MVGLVIAGFCNALWHRVCSPYRLPIKPIVMKLQDFNALSLRDQIKTVFNKGAYVADRLEHEFTVVLYTLSRFCVEVYYHETESEPVSLRSFSCTDKLEPYFNEVALASIV